MSEQRKRLRTTTEIPELGKLQKHFKEQRYQLKIEGSDSDGALTLGNNVVVIGRDESCDLRINASNVSRKHAQITFVSEEYLIEDLESTNGTMLNGVRIVRATLKHSDVITIGKCEIKFVEE